MDQGNRVAVNHADTVGLVQKRTKSYEIANLLSSYTFLCDLSVLAVDVFAPLKI